MQMTTSFQNEDIEVLDGVATTWQPGLSSGMQAAHDYSEFLDALEVSLVSPSNIQVLIIPNRARAAKKAGTLREKSSVVVAHLQ